MHPSVQSGLADVFVDAMKNRNVQIIVESHSEHLLRRLQRRVADETVSPDKVALYFCEATDNGSQLTSLHLDLFGNIQNWPKDFFGDEFSEMAAITKAAMERKTNGIRRAAAPCRPFVAGWNDHLGGRRTPRGNVVM